MVNVFRVLEYDHMYIVYIIRFTELGRFDINTVNEI